jgi:hypothetical protein
MKSIETTKQQISNVSISNCKLFSITCSPCVYLYIICSCGQEAARENRKAKYKRLIELYLFSRNINHEWYLKTPKEVVQAMNWKYTFLHFYSLNDGEMASATRRWISSILCAPTLQLGAKKACSAYLFFRGKQKTQQIFQCTKRGNTNFTFPPTNCSCGCCLLGSSCSYSYIDVYIDTLYLDIVLFFVQFSWQWRREMIQLGQSFSSDLQTVAKQEQKNVSIVETVRFHSKTYFLIT